MNRIVINGCMGRMGKTLIKLIEQNEEMVIVAGVDPCRSENISMSFPVYSSLKELDVPADIVIDFSNAAGVPGLLESVVENKLGIVVATTGLDETAVKLMKKASESVPLFFSFNMSLGINLLKTLITRAAQILGPDYDVEIIEKHHKMKKDAPSGTAFVLADALSEVRDFDYTHGRRESAKAREAGELGIHAVRGGTIIGEHEVIFAGPDEVVEIGHKAYSREMFARGAIRAAGFLVGKSPGFYGMDDLFGI